MRSEFLWPLLRAIAARYPLCKHFLRKSLTMFPDVVTTENNMKAIQVIPKDARASQQIDALAKQLRTSRAGLVGLALEFFLPKIESGEVAVINGEVKFVKQQAEAA
jgi:hypothetical protein